MLLFIKETFVHLDITKTKNTMLTIKKKKETDTELRHFDLFLGGLFIGYYIQNKSNFATVGENWNFVPKHPKLKHFYSKTKKDLLSELEILCEQI